MFSHFRYLLLLTLLLSPLTLADQFSPSYDQYNAAAYGKRPIQTFVSNPSLSAPLLHVSTWEPSKISPTGGSHIFLRHDYEQSSPLILSATDLSVVYMNRSYDRTSDIRPQRIGNQTFLTFYSGSIVDGHGSGDGLVLDGAYREAHRVQVSGLGRTRNDLHEFEVTADGTALVTAYDEVRMDLKPYGGSTRGVLLDGVFQEINVTTGEVLFQWRASEHVELRDSFYRMESKWDFFHINSVQKTQAGNYLISARHMHSIYLISGTTGDILWTLGGKTNQFTELDPVSNPSGDALLTFAWQHHARFLPNTNDTELTFFDNHALTTTQHCKHDCSRGLHVRLDTAALTAQIVTEYLHPQSLQAQSQGSVQPLADGNVFVGWGRCPSFTEHTADGEAVMEVQFSPWHTRTNEIALDNYRAYRGDWHATPEWNPDVVARTEEDGEDAGEVKVYVSWNGATEVRYWAFVSSSICLGHVFAGVLI